MYYDVLHTVTYEHEKGYKKMKRKENYSGTPPYDHPVYKTTSLLRPGFYGPTVVVLTGFHCRVILLDP